MKCSLCNGKIFGRNAKTCAKCYTKKRSGEGNPKWRGGKCIRGRYRFIYAPDHPGAVNGTYIREHRLVMEKKIGRLLLKNEVVHHINKNTLDNRIENLQLLTRGQHTILHHKGSTMSKETREKMSISGKIGWVKRRQEHQGVSP